MTPFFLGQRVEWQHSSGVRVFRGNLIAWISGKFYAVVQDDTGRPPRIVRTDRLRHIGGCKRPEGVVA